MRKKLLGIANYPLKKFLLNTKLCAREKNLKGGVNRKLGFIIPTKKSQSAYLKKKARGGADDNRLDFCLSRGEVFFQSPHPQGS
jgi:hypothetical protein